MMFKNANVCSVCTSCQVQKDYLRGMESIICGKFAYLCFNGQTLVKCLVAGLNPCLSLIKDDSYLI